MATASVQESHRNLKLFCMAIDIFCPDNLHSWLDQAHPTQLSKSASLIGRSHHVQSVEIALTGKSVTVTSVEYSSHEAPTVHLYSGVDEHSFRVRANWISPAQSGFRDHFGRGQIPLSPERSTIGGERLEGNCEVQ